LILITTSHRPSQRTRSFAKDLASVIPFSARVTRGKSTIDDLVMEAYRNNLPYIVIIGEKQGNPSRLDIYRVDRDSVPPQARRKALIQLSGVKLSRENPDSIRIYNPRTVGVNYDQCVSNECFTLSDILVSIMVKALSENPDVRIVLKDKEYIYVEFYSSTGRMVGPVLKVSKVVLYK